jgi:general secretion pathway protein M
MKDWFAQLNQREQMSLFILSLAVGLYLLFVLLWSPLAGKRDALEVQNSAIAGSLARVDAMVSELLQLRDGGGSVNTRRNLTSLINQSTSRMELQVSRLQPSSRGDIQVRLENASFDDVLEWLHEMEYREGLLVREVSVTQAGSAGRVNATVRIAQAG